MVALAQSHHARLYWTPHIENECYRNLLRLGRLHPEDAEADRCTLPQRLNAELLPQNHLPYLADVAHVEEKDRHVAASALALRHQLQQPVGLITWNLKDFPRKQLLKLGVVRYSPDELCEELTKPECNTLACLEQSVCVMMHGLNTYKPKNPTVYQLKAQPLPTRVEEWLEFLSRNKMHRTARGLCRQSNLPRYG